MQFPAGGQGTVGSVRFTKLAPADPTYEAKHIVNNNTLQCASVVQHKQTVRALLPKSHFWVRFYKIDSPFIYLPWTQFLGCTAHEKTRREAGQPHFRRMTSYSILSVQCQIACTERAGTTDLQFPGWWPAAESTSPPAFSWVALVRP
jgi:hypothetical protein